MVSIDRVYQKVLALANKEQRGYITPQEFNLFADHAQMEIFEQYFYDLNQFLRTPGNSAGHSDIVTNIEEKISFFENYDENTRIESSGNIVISGITDLYRVEMVRVIYENETVSNVAEEIQLNELNKYGGSALSVWSKKRPVYTRYASESLKVYPNPTAWVQNEEDDGYTFTDRVLVSYIKRPAKPNWSYIVANNKPLYSDDGTDFELHPAEETELVYRILALAGVAIEKPQLTQVASAFGGNQIQQEKQ